MMARRLVDCPHCGGTRDCKKSGGRSCKGCLKAAGMGKSGFATVRCAYCGGKGKIWEDEEETAAEAPAEEAKEE